MKKILLFALAIIISVVAVGAFWAFFVADFYKVNESAMQPNYNQDDLLLVKKAGNIHRKDVIIFHSPDSGLKIIRRVIGIPGDYIEIKDGKIFITPKDSEKSEELKEIYLSKNTKTCLTPSNSCASTLDFAGRKYQVPNESYFVLGDNRSESQDSRHWRKDYIEYPFINSEDIVAKVNFKIWPL